MTFWQARASKAGGSEVHCPRIAWPSVDQRRVNKEFFIFGTMGLICLYIYIRSYDSSLLFQYANVIEKYVILKPVFDDIESDLTGKTKSSDEVKSAQSQDGLAGFSISKEELEEEAEAKQCEKPRNPEPRESEKLKPSAVEEPEQKHPEHNKTPEICPPTSKPEMPLGDEKPQAEQSQKHSGEPSAHEQSKQDPEETYTKAPEPSANREVQPEEKRQENTKALEPCVDEKPQPAELEVQHDKPGEAHGETAASKDIVEIQDDSQQHEVFQDSQTPPEWKEDAAFAKSMNEIKETADPKPDSSATAEDTQPVTPCKDLLSEFEREEEREDLKSDEEDLAKRQAFKD